MDFTAKHMGFVLACYGISAALLLITSTVIVMRSKRNDRKLAELELTRQRQKK